MRAAASPRRPLEFIAPHVKAGVTTGKLDQLCHEFILEHNAIPAPLNYKGFPKSICTSVNQVVCHGIPGDRVLVDGDIINIDVTTILDGYHGDTSEMFCVGDVPEKATTLIDVTRRAMWLGIHEVGPGKRIGDIGAAIYEFAHGEHGYGVVEAFCGHGIGRKFHTEPQVSHKGKRGRGRRMVSGHDLHHRADDQRGHGEVRDPRRRLDGDHVSTVVCPRRPSTRSWSPTTGSRC